MDKAKIIGVLEEIAVLLELSEANPFEVMAFRNGAANLDDWEGDLDRAVAEEALTEIHGIGKGLAAVIRDLVRDGRSERYDTLRTRFPDKLLELVHVPGLGTKKIRALHQQLGIDGLDSLETAARERKIRALAGFGPRSEERILSGIERARRRLG